MAWPCCQMIVARQLQGGCTGYWPRVVPSALPEDARDFHRIAWPGRVDRRPPLRHGRRRSQHARSLGDFGFAGRDAGLPLRWTDVGPLPRLAWLGSAEIVVRTEGARQHV